MTAQELKHEFFLSIIYRYLEAAKSSSPKLAKEIIEEIQEVSNFNEFKAQLENINFDKYRESILKNLIKTISDPSTKITEDDRSEILNGYEFEKITPGKQEIEEFNKAIEKVNNCQLSNAMETGIQIINKLFGDKVETK